MVVAAMVAAATVAAATAGAATAGAATAGAATAMVVDTAALLVDTTTDPVAVDMAAAAIATAAAAAIATAAAAAAIATATVAATDGIKLSPALESRWRMRPPQRHDAGGDREDSEIKFGAGALRNAGRVRKVPFTLCV